MADIVKELKILCSIKEVDKNHLWLRPRLDRDGYDLFYWGTKGWSELDIYKHEHIHDRMDKRNQKEVESFDKLNNCKIIDVDNRIEALEDKIAEIEKSIYPFLKINEK